MRASVRQFGGGKLQRQFDADVAGAGLEEGFEVFQRGVFDLAQPGVAPGIAAVEQDDAAPVVQDDVAGLGGDLRISGREGTAQGADLLEATVVAGRKGDGRFPQGFHERPGGGIVYNTDRECGPGNRDMDLIRHLVFCFRWVLLLSFRHRPITGIRQVGARNECQEQDACSQPFHPSKKHLHRRPG